MYSFRTVLGYTAVMSALLIPAACSRQERTETRERARETAANKTGTAQVRFIDEHTGAGNLYFGDTLLFDGGSRKVTEYKPVSAERREFTIRTSPTAEALAHNSEGLDNGDHYTVVAFDDKEGKPSLRIVKDDESAPASGKAKVRIIHASNEMQGLKLYAQGQKNEIADASRFTTGSNWEEVNPVKGTLEMRGSDDKTRPVRIPDVHLEAGKLYTFVVGGDANNRMHVTTIVDNPTA
jgi:hypothetical protein